VFTRYNSTTVDRLLALTSTIVAMILGTDIAKNKRYLLFYLGIYCIDIEKVCASTNIVFTYFGLVLP